MTLVSCESELRGKEDSNYNFYSGAGSESLEQELMQSAVHYVTGARDLTDTAQIHSECHHISGGGGEK